MRQNQFLIMNHSVIGLDSAGKPSRSSRVGWTHSHVLRVLVGKLGVGTFMDDLIHLTHGWCCSRWGLSTSCKAFSGLALEVTHYHFTTFSWSRKVTSPAYMNGEIESISPFTWRGNRFYLVGGLAGHTAKGSWYRRASFIGAITVAIYHRQLEIHERIRVV